MTSAMELTDDALMRRMVAGDEEAFAVLYRRRHPSIYRFALRMSGNPALAEDVTQEVFMTLVRDAKRFDPTRGTLSAFLFGVARNFLRKRWEQDRRLVPLAGDADDLGEFAPGKSAWSEGTTGHSPASAGAYGLGNGGGAAYSHAQTAGRDEFAALETVGRVRHAIGTLPENYREVVVLCELQEMSYEEAATALGCPVGTVRSRLHRARAILLEKLRDAQPLRRAAPVE